VPQYIGFFSWPTIQLTATALPAQAGRPPIRFHDLRHTAATILLTRGINPKVVSEMLGHASVAFTLDTYSHVLPEMQAQAAAAMDAALGPG
jgi:integrase